jgi:hypothetical protein
MIGTNLRDQSDHMVNSLQIWFKESEPWKNILL